MLPAAILRLMAYTTLSRRVRLGPEDRVCIEFATRLRAAHHRRPVERRLGAPGERALQA